nr:helix-turn-helix domain-containing protein [Frankia casuarinae]
MAAADRFAQGASRVEVARELRVTRKTASCWYRAWEAGGAAALRSAGPLSRCRLDDRDLARLEAILRRGPGRYGWDDQRWTLARVGPGGDREGVRGGLHPGRGVDVAGSAGLVVSAARPAGGRAR